MVRRFPSAEQASPSLLPTVSFPPAAANRGQRRVGSDGLVYEAMLWDGAWQWVSAAQIAAETAADVLRAATADMLIHVGRGGSETDGVRYHTIGAALDYVSRFVPAYRESWQTTNPLRVWIVMEAGFSIREQLFLRQTNVGHVLLTSEDATVTVEEAYLTRCLSLQDRAHPLIHALDGAVPPQISGTRLIFDQLGAPQDPLATAAVGAYTPRPWGMFVGSGCSGVVSGRNTAYDGTGITRRAGGIERAWNNVVVSEGGAFTLSNAGLDDAGRIGLLCRGDAGILGATVRGAGFRSISCAGRVYISTVGIGDGAVYPGVYSGDFRRVPETDGANDLHVSDGGRIRRPAGVRGGSNIQPNSLRPEGLIYAEGSAMLFEGRLALQQYTLATRPPAAALEGQTIIVTDGDGGQPCLQTSISGGWWLSPLSPA